MKYGRSGH
jgi:N-acetylneuraminic acid mutarotase